MRRFILARAGQALVVVIIVSTLVFLLAHLAPGDPFWAIEDVRLSVADRERLRAVWGYDQPLWRQYVMWGTNFVRGDFGWSHAQSRAVSEILRDAIPNTLMLMSPGLVLGMLLGIVLGTWQAVDRPSIRERIVNGITLTIISIPDFVLALIALLLFAIKWRLAPSAGMQDPVMHESMSWGGRVQDIAAHLWLPVTTLAIVVAASISRYQRTAVLGVLGEDYIRTARSKGATERRVVYGHALRNSLGPAITIGGLLLPAMFAGAVFIERIFSLHGVGDTLVSAVAGRDYALVQAIAVLGTVIVTMGAALSDIVAAIVNPRLTLQA